MLVDFIRAWTVPHLKALHTSQFGNSYMDIRRAFLLGLKPIAYILRKCLVNSHTTESFVHDPLPINKLKTWHFIEKTSPVPRL